jgi:hypothetical protein
MELFGPGTTVKGTEDDHWSINYLVNNRVCRAAPAYYVHGKLDSITADPNRPYLRGFEKNKFLE